MNYFILFALIVGPMLTILFCLLGIWESNRADRSVAQWREDNLKAQERMRRESDWYKKEK